MSQPAEHSRREFLQGRAAVRAAVGKAQGLVDSAAQLLGAPMATGPLAHVHASRRAMACEFAIQYHESDSELQHEVLSAFDLIDRIEAQLTIYRDHSEVIAINQQAAREPVEVDADLFELLLQCQQLYRETDGALDITSGPLSRVWGFLERAGRMPAEEEIAAALERVRGTYVVLDEAKRTINFDEAGVEINFNSIGKGYALDRAAAALDAAGLRDYLWHGGGSSVLSRGANRSDEGNCWTVGLRHPLQPKLRLAEFHLRDRALGTAGGASQFFEQAGRRFSHIIDPRTGWPVEDVYSATVLAPTAARADGLATAFFVMSVEEVEKYCAQHTEVGAVLVCPGNEPAEIAIRAFGMLDSDWTPPILAADS